MNQDFPVIVVDDEYDFCIAVKGLLETEGFRNITICEEGKDLFPSLDNQKTAVVLLDLNMPGKSGRELLPGIKDTYPESEVIILTGVNDVDMAVSCIKEGAFDYLVKPIDKDRFLTCIRHAIDICSLRTYIERINERFLAKPINNPGAFCDIITEDKSMLSTFSYCEAVSAGNQPIFVTGETGTGKELIAKAIHTLSGRKGKFVAVNIAGLDEKMLNSALFGYVKGAFTGADKNREGLIEEAAGGTLFLDEIGDLNLEAQIKLNRLLQEYEYLPVGAVKARKSDTRIVSATHMDIDALVEKERFRKDLYFRLSTHHIHLPRLKERLSDLPLLLDFFLAEAAKEYKKRKPTYPPELINLLETYHFPGNIRELRSMVYDAVSVHKSRKLSMQIFRNHIKRRRKVIYRRKRSPESQILFPDVLPTIKNCAEYLIEEAMKRAGNNQKIAAESLGITQQALNKRFSRKARKR
jgi:DNA-binding NtrC family response regulator